jgi:hypothetical protein
MATAYQRPRATYQDVIDAPDHMVAEIIGGELRLTSRPAAPGIAVASALSDELGPPFKRGRGGPGGWLILNEPELHLGDEIIVPDLAGWRRARLAVVPDAAFITTPPDWVCEVLSKSTEKTDRADKLPIYASCDVGYAWLVHPRRRTLEAYRLVERKWLTLAVYQDADRARIQPFDAIELDLALLWADAPLPTRACEEPAHYAYEGY